MIEWSKEKEIILIIDESFVDFVSTTAEEKWEDYTLLKEEIITAYSKLFIVKNISKSYGISGFRLGILAGSNAEFIDKIKKDIAIWNINSYGEFFMQIIEKYKNDYAFSLTKIKTARAKMLDGLISISALKVYSSQANYIMCQILDSKWTSRLLAAKLLEKNIYIKDLTPKINNDKQYIRLAVRNEK